MIRLGRTAVVCLAPTHERKVILLIELTFQVEEQCQLKACSHVDRQCCSLQGLPTFAGNVRAVVAWPGFVPVPPSCIGSKAVGQGGVSVGLGPMNFTGWRLGCARQSALQKWTAFNQVRSRFCSWQPLVCQSRRSHVLCCSFGLGRRPLVECVRVSALVCLVWQVCQVPRARPMHLLRQTWP